MLKSSVHCNLESRNWSDKLSDYTSIHYTDKDSCSWKGGLGGGVASSQWMRIEFAVISGQGPVDESKMGKERSHCNFSWMSLGFHFDFTWTSRQFHFEFALISLRFQVDVHFLDLIGWTWSPLDSIGLTSFSVTSLLSWMSLWNLFHRKSTPIR